MSKQDKKGLTGSTYKMRLEQMGMSFDRMYHPESYYEKMYLNTSNAKSKVTRNNTPFYHEQIINRKRERERESNKKKKITKNKINDDEDYSSLNEEEINLKSSRKRKNDKSQNKNIKNENDVNDSGIKVTRLIKRDKKILRSDNNDLKELKDNNEIIDKLRSPRTRRSLNDNKNKYDDFIYYNEGFNKLKSKSKSKNKNSQKNYKEKENKVNKNINKDENKKDSQSKEKNIINNTAQNINYNIDYNYNEPTKNGQNDNMDINDKTPQKDYYLNVEEKNRSNNYNNPEENELNQDNLNNNDNDNIQINEELDQTQENEDNKEYTDVSSNYSQATSFFSRFSAFSNLSLGKLGTGFVNMKNSIMNKFRRNAYLLPLVILILFGIIFFLNERYESFERNNIIIVFSILMGLIVLFHLYKYFKEKMKYKKIAKEHKKKLMELLEENNIKKEDIGNNVILLSQFFEEVINDSGLDYDTYMKYVFPYLVKYLKKDGYILEKQEDEENGENNLNYWKKM